MRFPDHERRDCGSAGVLNSLRDERGQALIVAALSMALLLGFLGFAVDVGLLFVAKRKMQVAADTAAIAGAAELNYGDYTTSAQAAAALNGFTNGANGITVSVNPSGTATPSPLYGAYKGQSGYLEVVVSQNMPTYFMRMFNQASVLVEARSVAALGVNQNCIYALGATGTDVTMNNGAKLSATSCGLIDNSSSATALSVTDGASLTAASIEVVGSDTVAAGATVSPTPVTSIAPISDPLAFLAPPSYNAAQCTADPQQYYGNGVSSYTIGPGSAHSTTQSGNLVCYTSLTVGGNGFSVTLNPGIYVVTGGLTFAAGGNTPTATGITFYLPGSSALSIANGATFNLSAPTSGTYDGILFYQDRANTTAASIQGGASSVLQGILYFPDASLTMGNGSNFTYEAPIVAQSFILYGGSNFTDNSYSAINSSSPLTSARVVE